ncbi:MAG: MurR/RpiR family transcriptional regulator [Sphaerochaeta sp.]
MSSLLFLLQQLTNSDILSERRLATEILNNPEEIIHLSITELAKVAKVSSSSINRLCKKLGIGGYQDLRLAIAKEIFSKKYENTQNLQSKLNYDGSSTVFDITSNILEVITDAIIKIDKLINRDNIKTVVEKIQKARTILLVGTGASGIVGKDFHLKLCRLGFLSQYDEDPELQTMSACSLTEQDVVIAISYSGERKTLIRTIKEAKQNGAFVVAITRFQPTTLLKLADTSIFVPDTEALYREGALVSRLCQLIIVDIIYSSLIAKDIDKSIPLLTKTWFSIQQDIKT